MYSIDYYLKTPENSGSDSTVCYTFESACGTITFVMRSCVNVSGRSSVVYVDSGTYSCGLNSAGTSANPADSFSNVIFFVTAYSSSNFKIDDINTYPEIVSDVGGEVDGFAFCSNVKVSFQYIKCSISGNAASTRYFFGSLFILIFFFFNFFLIFLIF
jgi:hypothetical protein